MKFLCVSESPACYVIQFLDMRIMIDCGIRFSAPSQKSTNNTTSMTDSSRQVWANNASETPWFDVPQFALVDLQTIDAILITNFDHMLGLPYLTEYLGFSGRIFATEPTIHIGQRLMEELVQYGTEKADCLTTSTQSIIEDPDDFFQMSFSSSSSPSSVCKKKIYTAQDVLSCIAKIESVSFQQISTLNSLRVTPVSSGFCIGACNWVVESDYEKISFISDSSLTPRHPEAFDPTLFKNSDVMIATNVSSLPADCTYEASINSMLQHLALVLANGGNALFPIDSCGVVLDLLENMTELLRNLGTTHTALYFVSPASEFVLLYSNILGEWLCKAKKEKLYLPEQPFPFEDFVKLGKIQFQTRLNGTPIHKTNGITTFPFDHPSTIVFAGHSSLCEGPVLQLLQMWGKSQKNALFLTDPTYDYKPVIANLQSKSDFGMKVVVQQLESRLSPQKLADVVKVAKPRHLLTSVKIQTHASLFSNFADLSSASPMEEANHQTFVPLESISISLNRKFEKAFLSKDVKGILFSSFDKALIKPYSKFFMHDLTFLHLHLRGHILNSKI